MEEWMWPIFDDLKYSDIARIDKRQVISEAVQRFVLGTCEVLEDLPRWFKRNCSKETWEGLTKAQLHFGNNSNEHAPHLVQVLK